MTSRRLLILLSAIVTTILGSTAASAQAPIRVGGDIKEPKALFKPDPVYPAIAKQAKVEGQVIVEATIGTDGTVRDVRVLRGNALFNDAAIEAVRKWKFETTFVNGAAVDVLMTTVVNFSLNAPAQGDVNALLDQAKTARAAGRDAEVEQLLQRALEQVRAERVRQDTAPSSPTATTAPLRIGGAITEPRRTKYVAPVYPSDAKDAHVEGSVIIEAVIATDGTVKGARVLRGVPMFNQAALDAVKQWAYDPTLLNGVPVEIAMTVVVNFVMK